MESLVIYLLKASALLGIFYLSYLFLLKRETTFELNRKYLLLGLITAGILPGIYFTRKVYIEASTQSFDFIPGSTVSQVQTEAPIDWWQIAGVIYLIITGLFIFRLCFQLSAVMRIIASHKFQKMSGQKYLKTTKNQLPFSFFNYIIFNPDKHSEKELELILEHEKVHAKQFHSVDILLVNLASCILWFNPFAWLYKKSVEQNLEFIADRETVNNKAEIKEYQHVLVKVSIANLKPALTNHFYQSFIKKRILMLNKKSSTHSPAWKLGLLMPLLLVFMLLFNVNTEAQIKNTESIEGSGSTDDVKTEISVTITSNTSKKSLEHFSKVFKRQNVNLKFEDIERSSEGILTNITVRFQDKEIGNKGEITKNDPSGIESFVIFQNSENGIGFREANAFHSRTMMNENGNIISQIGKSPLYIINGKEYTAASLQNKHVGFEGKLEALAPKLAIDTYGQKAKDGVIIINNGKIIENFSEELKRIDADNKNLIRNFLEINPDYEKPVLITLNNKSDKKDRKAGKKISAISKESGKNKTAVSVEVTGTGYITEDPEEIMQNLSPKHVIGFQSHKPTTKVSDYEMMYGSGVKETNVMGTQIVRLPTSAKKSTEKTSSIRQTGDPIYIVDGIAVDENFDINSINTSDISSIMVLKGAQATDKYGDKARNGAIQIFTKAHKGNEEPAPAKPRFVAFSGTTSNSELKNIAQKIENDLKIEVEFSDIVRNEENVITKIVVNATKDNQNASTNLISIAGLKSIMIGLSDEGEITITSRTSNNQE